MKKSLILFLSIALATHATMTAQEVSFTYTANDDSTQNTPKTINNESGVETHTYNNLVSKTITYESDKKKTVWNISLPKVGNKRPKKKKPSWNRSWESEGNIGPEDIYFGFTGMVTEDFDLKPASSWEWGFSLMRFSVWNPSETFAFRSTLLLSRSSYRIKGDDAFHIDAAGMTVCDNALRLGSEPLQYHKQRLIHWSWRIPVEMCWRTDNGHQYTLGVEGEMRHHVRSRAQVGGTKKYYIDRNNLDVNPFGLNAVGSFGWEGISIFGRCSITDFFGKKSLVQATPVMVGIICALGDD